MRSKNNPLTALNTYILYSPIVVIIYTLVIRDSKKMSFGTFSHVTANAVMNSHESPIKNERQNVVAAASVSVNNQALMSSLGDLQFLKCCITDSMLRKDTILEI